MYFARGVDVHRVRRNFNAFRGGRKSSAKYYVRNGLDVFGDWLFVGDGGVRRPACMAGFAAVPESGSILCLCRGADLGATTFDRRADGPGRYLRIWYGSTYRRGSLAL